MGKIKSALYRFMYGRYGTDTIGRVMLVTYIVIVIGFSVARLVLGWTLPIGHRAPTILDIVYRVLSILLVILIFCRMFSRNIAKRRRENEKFCGFFKLWRNKIRDRKTHVYRKCPKCAAVLRLPKAKGKHNVVCPRCKERFEVRG